MGWRRKEPPNPPPSQSGKGFEYPTCPQCGGSGLMRTKTSHYDSDLGENVWIYSQQPCNMRGCVGGRLRG